jgi:hypothetical protein
MKKLLIVLLSAFLLNAGLYAADGAEDALWLQFLNELAQKVAGSDQTNVVQTLFPFKLWDWGGKDYPVGSIPYQQQDFLDVVPTAPVGNYMGSPLEFSSDYLQFLSQLNLQAGDPKIDELYQKYKDKSREYATLDAQAHTAYKNDRNRPEDEPYSDWLAKNTYWKNKLAQAEKDMKLAEDNYNNYRAEKFEDIRRALEMYDNNLIYITNRAGQQELVAPWFTDQIPYDFVMTITGDNFGGDATRGNAFSFKINEQTSKYDYQRYWGTAELGVDFWFFSIDTKGSFERVNRNVFKSDWSISFSFQSFDQITVGTPAWLDTGVVMGRRNGPYRTGFVGYRSQAGPGDTWFFGDGGILARRFTAMWVGYRPTVVIDAGEEIHTYVKEKIEAGGSMQIGPFRFSAGGSSETESSFDFTYGTHIIVENKSDWPYILCVATYPTVPSESLNNRMVEAKKAALAKKKKK